PVDAFPALGGRPVKSKNYLGAGLQRAGVEIGVVDAQAAVARGRIADRAPAVAAPVHRRSGEELDPQDAAGGHGARLLVEAPDAKARAHAFDLVAPVRLRRQVEDAAVR